MVSWLVGLSAGIIESVIESEAIKWKLSLMDRIYDLPKEK